MNSMEMLVLGFEEFEKVEKNLDPTSITRP